MSLAEPIRILSDLHFGHPASLIRNVEQLAPLLRGVRTVVFNGDSVELRFLRGRQHGQQNARLLRDLCARAGAEPLFIDGNHDPILAHVSHLDLAGGAILVTHGDLLFHDISPWSSEAEALRRAHTQELAELDEHALLDFEQRLKASKRAALSLELHKPRVHEGPFAGFFTVLRECWPPWRPFQIFHCWIVTPSRADALASVFRPHAHIVIIGHTHFAGVWKRGRRIIINTGSYLGVGGRFAVDITGDQVTVRRIKCKDALFHLDGIHAEFTARRL